MSPSFSEHVLNHAHDIAFAVFRVAGLAKNLKLKISLEDAAVNLISDLNRPTVDKLALFIKLAVSVGEMKPANADILKRELCKLNEEIYRLMIGEREDINLEKFFSETSKTITFGNESGNESGNNAATGKVGKTGNQVMDRQASMVEFMHNFPDDCRMKNILAAFPKVSERTLRNDIQNLISEGTVERMGNSGPNTSFKLISPVTKS